MPRVIDYPIVLEQLTAAGFVSLYHNAGAFGFAADAHVHAIGWVGVDDPTIRDAARGMVRKITEPYAPTLARMLEQAWLSHLPGPCWLMPKSHWHYELHFGNRELLKEVLPELGINPALLRERNDGSAIEFAAGESALLRETAERLLSGLRGSDFMIAFPRYATLCTIHHHQQLWWQTREQALAQELMAI